MNELLLGAILLCSPCQITSYRSVPAQTDETPFITADGGRVHKYGAAVSRDLLWYNGGPLRYGDIIYVEYYGFKVVNDTMNKRYRNAVDLWVKTYKEEKAVGVRKGRIWKIKTH
jgi:3D (Asp-Asp-Asp) domain-containing protein